MTVKFRISHEDPHVSLDLVVKEYEDEDCTRLIRSTVVGPGKFYETYLWKGKALKVVEREQWKPKQTEVGPVPEAAVPTL